MTSPEGELPRERIIGSVWARAAAEQPPLPGHAYMDERGNIWQPMPGTPFERLLNPPLREF